MTEIDFHIKVPDVRNYACRILRIAYNKGAKVVVFDDNVARLKAFDDQLWTFSALDFIPHVMAGDANEGETPIVLTSDDSLAKVHDVILNLSDNKPPGFGSFKRLVEFVPTEGESLIAARQRYKFYKDRGYTIRTHDYRELAR
jgi:DNA polymerase III subunit chi